MPIATSQVAIEDFLILRILNQIAQPLRFGLETPRLLQAACQGIGAGQSLGGVSQIEIFHQVLVRFGQCLAYLGVRECRF